MRIIVNEGYEVADARMKNGRRVPSNFQAGDVVDVPDSYAKKLIKKGIVQPANDMNLKGAMSESIDE